MRLIGVEAAGHGIETGKHAAALNGGKPGILHGNRTYLLQTDDGQIIDAHSMPSFGMRDAPNICRVRTRRRWTRSSSAPGLRASSRRWSRPTRWRVSAKWRKTSARMAF